MEAVLELRRPSQIVNLPLICTTLLAFSIWYWPEHAYSIVNSKSPAIIAVAGDYLKADYFLYAGGILAAFLLYKALFIGTISYTLTDQRIVTKSGVFLRTTDTMELYRVEDLQIVEPLYLRIFGLANVFVLSSDRTKPRLLLMAIPKAESLFTNLRLAVERSRRTAGVRILDM